MAQRKRAKDQPTPKEEPTVVDAAEEKVEATVVEGEEGTPEEAVTPEPEDAPEEKVVAPEKDARKGEDGTLEYPVGARAPKPCDAGM